MIRILFSGFPIVTGIHKDAILEAIQKTLGSSQNVRFYTTLDTLSDKQTVEIILPIKGSEETIEELRAEVANLIQAEVTILEVI